MTKRNVGLWQILLEKDFWYQRQQY